MARHFFSLYCLIVLTLAAVSWGQDKLNDIYGGPEAADDGAAAVAMSVLAGELRNLPVPEWRRRLAAVAAGTGAELELFDAGDIAGRETLQKLRSGQTAHMRSTGGDSWTLAQLDGGHVLAIKSRDLPARRGPLEWTLTLLFYALIGLVLMIWIWPLTRDLRALEGAAASFGNRNWRFDVDIKPHSQIYPLAQAFRKMAARIDGLIASHKDMSNAVTHEIKTPLARMQFEIELAQHETDSARIKRSLRNIKADIAELDGLVAATMEYAILERADLSLKLAAHDFTTLIPAIIEDVHRDARPGLTMTAEVDARAGAVVCDAHLIEAVLKNLLYNAARYARAEVRVGFETGGGAWRLLVDDDGPGIRPSDRQRVFDSFLQLEQPPGTKSGFGLGLAIVKRAVEWHGGEVSVEDSPLGGARFCATWPDSLRAE